MNSFAINEVSNFTNSGELDLSSIIQNISNNSVAISTNTEGISAVDNTFTSDILNKLMMGVF